MALFYSAKKTQKSPQLASKMLELTIDSLDYQGLGVAKLNGKTWFVENALPSETVQARVLEDKRQFGRAQAVKIRQHSAQRLAPSCANFETCGGCQMQHIPLAMQREAKQHALLRRLQKLQQAEIDLQPMIIGESRQYRRRARLSIALQNNELVVGFRQAHSQQIITLDQCEILTAPLSALLPELQRLLQHWSAKKRLGHIELLHVDSGITLLLRHLGALNEQDRHNLLQFARHFSLNLFVQTEEEQVEQLLGEPPFYRLMGLELGFSVRDFIQVNAELNQKMVQTALEWLALSAQDRVLDLFCGMGNFTLPIALHAGAVVGIEGVLPMVIQARQNAARNQILNATFYQTDLDQPFHTQIWAKSAFNKVLLDPARGGAFFALDHLVQLSPERIVYISCNPATLVRDAEKLIQSGFILKKTAIIDMFPHTGHLESISLFQKM